MLVRLLACVALTSALSFVPAQTTPRLIGISLPTYTAPQVSLRLDNTTCQAQSCPTPLNPPPMGYTFAGGSAYDAAKGAIWHTNGYDIAAFHPGTCATICPVTSLAPWIGGGSFRAATGLAFNDSTKTLWLIDNSIFLRTFTAVCPISPGPVSCPLPFAVIPMGMVPGGLATADVQNLVFYSASFWSGAPVNTIYVASQATPCNPICKFLLKDCPGTVLGPIKGLAYDECKRMLWATDGTNVVGVSIAMTPTGCVDTVVACCRVPSPEYFLGLCIEPSHAVSLGGSCTTASCAACPAMSHDVLGDAAVGNPSLSLKLSNAPANATAILALNVGACSAPGVPIPPFCANLLVPLPGLVTVGLPTGGTAGCTGSANVTLAVPLTVTFCGFPLSSQYLVVCLGTPIGTGVTNCQTWMISST